MNFFLIEVATFVIEVATFVLEVATLALGGFGLLFGTCDGAWAVWVFVAVCAQIEASMESPTMRRREAVVL